jgi:hypothetical protein
MIRRTISIALLLPLLLSASAKEGDARLRIAWKDNFLTITGPDLPGGKMQILYLEAFCRPGSTKRQWDQTTIPHKTRLISAAQDGTQLVLESKLEDGTVFRHEIRAGVDEVNFQITASNPTDKPSQVDWAQPCVRVGPFTGGDKVTYLHKCFILQNGKLARMPTAHWATEAVYTPGQVWCPKGVSRDDVNPRPLNPDVADCGLIGCFSADEKKICAVAFEPYQELFQGVIACIHSDFRVGGLAPGETKKIHGKLYILPADGDALLKRYKADFAEERK